MQRRASQEGRESAAVREEAYKQGVMETSRLPVIFVDPDNIREIDMRFSHRPPYHRDPGGSLARQMDGQVPGSAQGLRTRVNEGEPDQKTMDEIARYLRRSGPAAMNKIMVNGQEYGIVIMPNRNFDTKEDIVDQFFSHLDRDERRAIVRNTPGTDSQWMRLIGNHEGEHLNDPVDRKSAFEVLEEEVRADRSARARALSRGEEDVALALKDFRALRSWGDPEHASSPLMLSNDAVNYTHVPSASNVTSSMASYVRNNFDWGSYVGKAKTPEDLLKENPEAYFDAARRGREAENARVVAAYNADPNNLDKQRAAIFAQVSTDYQNDFEDAYRRRLLGQNVPERAPTQLVSQEVEDRFFPEEKFQNRLASENISITNEAYAAYPDVRLFEGDDFLAGAANPEDALNAEYDKDPVKYFETLNERLGVLKDQAVADYAATPSYENLERLVQLEIVMNSAQKNLAFEQVDSDPSKTMADYVEPPPVQLVTDAQRRSYQEERFARQDAGTWTAPQPYVYTAPLAEAEPIFPLPGVIPEAELLVAGEALLTYNDDVVFEGVDWDKVDGPATSADELFIQDPRLYTEITAQRLEALSETVLADYKANPSYENLEKVVQIEMAMNQTNVFLAARQSADDPAAAYQQPTPVSLISEGERAGYYEARMQQEALKAEPAEAAPVEAAPPEPKTEGAATEQPAETVPEQKAEGGIGAHLRTYTPGVDGTAYTTVVAGLQGGQPLVDFEAENRISVGGLSMGSLFASSADPDPSSVSMINARLGAPEEALPDASMQMGQEANTSAAFRAPA